MQGKEWVNGIKRDIAGLLLANGIESEELQADLETLVFEIARNELIRGNRSGVMWAKNYFDNKK